MSLKDILNSQFSILHFMRATNESSKFGFCAISNAIIEPTLAGWTGQEQNNAIVVQHESRAVTWML